MSPKYTVFYFDIPGRAEIIRLVLHAAKQEFVDKRMTPKEWVEEYRDKMPTNYIPVLQIDDEMLFETSSIVQYLGRAHNLEGSTPVHAARCGAVICLVDEYLYKLGKVWELPIEERISKLDTYEKEEMPKLIEVLQKIKNKYGKEGFIVSDKLTIADLYVYTYFYYLHFWSRKPVEDEFAVKNHEFVESQPELKEYLSKRQPIEDLWTKFEEFYQAAKRDDC